MHGFVHPQPFPVRPRQELRESLPLAGHLLRPEDGGEFHEPGGRSRLESLEEIAQRKPVPRDHHRPALDAPHPIDPFLDGVRFEHVLHGVGARLAAQSVHRHGPGLRLERPCVPHRIALGRPELVVVGIRRHGLLRRQGVARRHDAFGNRELVAGNGRLGVPAESGNAGERGHCSLSGRREEVSPPQIQIARRDVARTDVSGRLDSHDALPPVAGL